MPADLLGADHLLPEMQADTPIADKAFDADGGDNTEAEAAMMAVDALIAALSFYTDAGRMLPTPSAARGRPAAVVPALIAAKLALHDAMVSDGVSNLELGHRAGADETSVRRLRDPLHRSHIGAVEQALAALGRRVEMTVRAA